MIGKGTLISGAGALNAAAAGGGFSPVAYLQLVQASAIAWNAYRQVRHALDR